MSDTDIKKEVNEELSRKAKLGVFKLEARKKLKSMLQDTSEWDIPEQIVQEIIATKTIANGNEPTNPEIVRCYDIYIEEKYVDNPEVLQLLKDCAPSIKALPAWKKKKGWEEAVWSYVRNDNLFSKENRANMIRALYLRGLEKDTVAAKIWLQLSGDLQENLTLKTDETVDKYREINQLLHGKK